MISSAAGAPHRREIQKWPFPRVSFYAHLLFFLAPWREALDGVRQTDGDRIVSRAAPHTQALPKSKHLLLPERQDPSPTAQTAQVNTVQLLGVGSRGPTLLLK